MNRSRPSSQTRDCEQISFPFDCIVVTSPDEASARLAKAPLSRILECRLRKDYPHQTIRVISTFDPYGARCGSGGGTLAALEFTEQRQSVLVLHAGGDSSRCPTQMILGKAWTSLPCHKYPNPTIWLIEQIQRLFESAHFPKGTVVVAATDTLITFFSKSQVQSKTSAALNMEHLADENVVLGVAVPASISTAKNHGVYILNKDAPLSTAISVADPLEVWQKPSRSQLLETMHPAPASFVPKGTTSPSDVERLAWIDTGVIIFSPKAANTLYDLSKTSLAMCTRAGIKTAYQAEGDRDCSIEVFAREHVVKLDLYTDILHNLKWRSQSISNNNSFLRPILSSISLKVLVAPQGTFLHLGTTQELVNFVTSGAYSSFDHAPQKSATTELAELLRLQPRFRCWAEARPVAQNVALQSTFPSRVSIGEHSMVEYCNLSSFESVKIGTNCMVSGWRNPSSETILEIPDYLSVQMIALERIKGTPLQHTYMVLGISDSIKDPLSSATIFGLGLSFFRERTGVTLADIGWEDENGLLWNAQIHPTVPSGTSFASLYGWLGRVLKGDSVRNDPSLLLWLSYPRVSLRMLHDVADAEAEWKFRQTLEEKVVDLQSQGVVPHLTSVLLERRHDCPCDLKWISELSDVKRATDLLENILCSLEALALEEFKKAHYDICGRAFMIASALISDCNTVLEEGEDNSPCTILNSFEEDILELRSLSLHLDAQNKAKPILERILNNRRVKPRCSLIMKTSEFSTVMERLSFCMNEFSIASGCRQDTNLFAFQRRNSPVVGKWIISTAPARIDLAGGWSDTPPICYEFGGSVTGVAVRVDERKPLSCRCRLSFGKEGILLRSENRASSDGSLLSLVEAECAHISDMSDFRNPLSDCALLKAALVCLGVITEDQIRSASPLQASLNRFFFGKDNFDTSARLEVVITSTLPQGSGMGSSSILAAITLSAIVKCAGFDDLSEDRLLNDVLLLEQLLSSGGGWQDQAHGILPGFKTVRSAPATLPISITIENVKVGKATLVALHKRMILVYTGKTRLAKGILQDVLRRWARSTDEIMKTTARNVALAEECKAELERGDIDGLGRVLHEYSSIKVEMAGEDSGAMPSSCAYFMNELRARNIAKGAALCGAGGGGFMVMILSSERCKNDVKSLLMDLSADHPDLGRFTLHDCQMCESGMSTFTLDDGNTGLEGGYLEWL